MQFVFKAARAPVDLEHVEPVHCEGKIESNLFIAIESADDLTVSKVLNLWSLQENFADIGPARKILIRIQIGGPYS